MYNEKRKSIIIKNEIMKRFISENNLKINAKELLSGHPRSSIYKISTDEGYKVLKIKIGRKADITRYFFINYLKELGNNVLRIYNEGDGWVLKEYIDCNIISRNCDSKTKIKVIDEVKKFQHKVYISGNDRKFLLRNKRAFFKDSSIYKYHLNPHGAKYLDIYNKNRESIIKYYESNLRNINMCHNDFHNNENLVLCSQNNDVYIIDYDTIRYDSPAYDFGQLLYLFLFKSEKEAEIFINRYLSDREVEDKRELLNMSKLLYLEELLSRYYISKYVHKDKVELNLESNIVLRALDNLSR